MAFPMGLSERERQKLIGGRTNINIWRKLQKSHRKLLLMKMLSGRPFGWGSKKQIAVALGVSRMTLHRYLKELEADGRCGCCGQVVTSIEAILKIASFLNRSQFVADRGRELSYLKNQTST